MKNLLRSTILCAAAALPLAVSAQGAKPEPEYTLGGNLTIGSDYRFRGFSQTDYQPTIQGGVDFAHKSGFYLGNWNSNVSSTLYNGAPIEMDFYGGWKTSFDSFGLDVGVIYYYYPGTGEYNPDFKAKNFEVHSYAEQQHGDKALELLRKVVITADVQRRCRQAIEHTILTNEWRARAMNRWLE